MTESETIDYSLLDTAKGDVYKYTNKGRVKEFDMNLLSDEEKEKFKKLSNKGKQRFIAAIELEQMPSMFDEISLKSIPHPDEEDNSLSDVQMAAVRYDELMNLLDDPQFDEMKLNYLKLPTIQKYIVKNCPHISQSDIDVLLKLKPDMSVNQYINYYKNIRDNKDLVALNRIQKELKNPYSDELLKEITSIGEDMSEKALKLIVNNDFSKIKEYSKLLNGKVLMREGEKALKLMGDEQAKMKEILGFSAEDYDKLSGKQKQTVNYTANVFKKIIKNLDSTFLPKLKSQLKSIGFTLLDKREVGVMKMKVNEKGETIYEAEKTYEPIEEVDDELKSIIYNKKLYNELQKYIQEKKYKEAIKILNKNIEHPSVGNLDYNSEIGKAIIREEKKKIHKAPRQQNNINLEPKSKDLESEAEPEPEPETYNEPPISTTTNIRDFDKTESSQGIPQILDVPLPEPVMTEAQIKQEILKSLPDDNNLYFLSSSFNNNPSYYGWNETETKISAKQLLTPDIIKAFTSNNPPIKSGYGDYLNDKNRFKQVLKCIKDGFYIIMALDLNSKNQYEWNRNKLKSKNVPEDLKRYVKRFIEVHQQYGKGLFSKIKKIYKAPESIEGIKDKLKTMDDMAKEINSLQTRIHENELMIKKMNEALNKLIFDKKVKIESKKIPQFLSDISKAPTLRHVEVERPKPKPINENPNSTEAMLKRKLEERRKDIEYSDDEPESETDWGAGMAGKIKIKTEDSQNKNGILMKDFFKKYLNLDSKADE